MRNLNDESDDNLRLIDPRCKICKSEHLEEINKMLIEGRSYSEIITKFPELKLNKNNIYRHKKHFNFIKAGVEKYEKVKQQLDEGADKVVDEIKTLDATIARMEKYVMTIDPEKKARSLEVCANTMLRAIKLKHEIAGNIEDPTSKLMRWINETLEE